MTIATTNPATGQTIRTFTPLSDAELDARLQCAVQAFRRNRKTLLGERTRMLLKAAEILESEKERFGRLMDAGDGQDLEGRGRRGREVCLGLPLLRRDRRSASWRTRVWRPMPGAASSPTSRSGPVLASHAVELPLLAGVPLRRARR